MTFLQKLFIISVLSAILALAVLTPRPRPASTTSTARGPSALGGLVAVWLAVVAVALIVVGIVSQTLLRHLIQIAPLVALGLLARRPAWGVSAAAPLFAFWLFIMGAIWLFLLGVARIVSGTFAPTEIALTIIIGVASLLGLRTAHRRGTTLTLQARLGTVTAFAVLQFAAVWLSVQPFVSRG